MTVIDFDKEKKKYLTHITGEARCVACKHEWVGEWPVGEYLFKCPSCGLVKGMTKGFINPQEDEHECSCGNSLFILTPSGTKCINCFATVRMNFTYYNDE
jgi:hypothetical protein